MRVSSPSLHACIKPSTTQGTARLGREPPMDRDRRTGSTTARRMRMADRTRMMSLGNVNEHRVYGGQGIEGIVTGCVTLRTQSRRKPVRESRILFYTEREPVCHNRNFHIYQLFKTCMSGGRESGLQICEKHDRFS